MKTREESPDGGGNRNEGSSGKGDENRGEGRRELMTPQHQEIRRVEDQALPIPHAASYL